VEVVRALPVTVLVAAFPEQVLRRVSEWRGAGYSSIFTW